jgi:hypothetical protein
MHLDSAVKMAVVIPATNPKTSVTIKLTVNKIASTSISA